MNIELPEWDRIPDIGLYMDQIVIYIKKVYGQESNDRYITPSMINNYVKNGLLPRPKGKKYDREQIAALLQIVFLKSVLSIETVKMLLICREPELAYTEFRNSLICEFGNTAEKSALKAAVSSAVSALKCEALLLNDAKEKEA